MYFCYIDDVGSLASRATVPSAQASRSLPLWNKHYVDRNRPAPPGHYLQDSLRSWVVQRATIFLSLHPIHSTRQLSFCHFYSTTQVCGTGTHFRRRQHRQCAGSRNHKKSCLPRLQKWLPQQKLLNRLPNAWAQITGQRSRNLQPQSRQKCLTKMCTRCPRPRSSLLF